MPVIYRTDGAWGTGKGSNLAPAEVDGNFYDVDTRVTFIEDNPVEPIVPTAINIEGALFTMGLSDGSTLGPIVMTYPMPTWRGNWGPGVAYNEIDFFVSPDNGFGTVMIPHTSAATFDWGALDTVSGTPVYRQLIGGSGTTSGIADLIDVAIGTQADNDLLVWDAAASLWRNEPAGAGSGTVTSVATGTGLTGGPVTTTGTISLATAANLSVLANISGGTAAPTPSTMSAILDAVFSSTRGSVLYRGAAGWAALGPGTAGNVLTTGGAGANPAWAAAAGGGLTVSDTAPAGAADSSLWFDSAGGQTYLRYNDGTSTQWVPVTNQPGPPGTNANISGLTAGQIGIAGSGTSLTSSIPTTTFVATAGGTMTGALTIAPSGGYALLQMQSIAGTANLIRGNRGSSQRWEIVPGDGVSEAGSNSGTNFNINRYSDAGASLGTPLTINRATGNATFAALLDVGAGIGAGGVAAVNGSIQAPYIVATVNVSAGTQGYKPGGGTWADSSDIRTKEADSIADYTTGLAAVLQLNPVTFKHNGKYGTARDGKTYVGLIANDVVAVMPEMVSVADNILDEDGKIDNPEEILSLEATALIYALVNSVKELSAKVQALEAAK